MVRSLGPRALPLIVAVVMGAPALLAQAPVGPRPEALGPIRTPPIQLARIEPELLLDSEGSFMPLRGTARGMSVYGIVQDHLGVLVPDAGTAQVRDIITGEVIAEAKVNELAQFSFRGLEPGLYTTELIGRGGSIISSSQAFSAAAGEVIQLAQTVPTIPLTGFGRFISSATSSVVSSAASAGVLAVAEDAPVTPEG